MEFDFGVPPPKELQKPACERCRNLIDPIMSEGGEHIGWHCLACNEVYGVRPCLACAKPMRVARWSHSVKLCSEQCRRARQRELDRERATKEKEARRAERSKAALAKHTGAEED